MTKRNHILAVFAISAMLILAGLLAVRTPSLAAGTTSTYLPIAFKRYPAQTIFGMELQVSKAGMEAFKATGPSWVRQNGLLWSQVEPNKGERNWAAAANLESNLVEFARQNIEPILIVRSTPAWAQKIAGATCGPILEAELASFGQFMYDAVARYSQPPYNVKYWEIWNEPDAVYSPTSPNGPYGCWGDPTDPYYGGGYYASMLQAVYPQIKAADPNAIVLVGGLLLDCDPRPVNGGPSYCAQWGNNELPPMYFEGILRNNGGNYFDGISFHAYDYFYYTSPELGHYASVIWGSYWNTTGPVGPVKAAFIRQLLAQYNVTGKFLVNTESALICGGANDAPGGAGCEADPGSLYEQTKARYVTQAYAAALADGQQANIWFSLFGWRNSGLIYSDLSPRPAYTAFQFASAELAGFSFQRLVTDYPGTQIYEFVDNGRNLWVVWSLDGANHDLTLPFTPLAIYDFMGTSLPANTSLSISLDPLFIEWK